jgi:anaerobic selenocysteine-containing dehydrogenase
MGMERESGRPVEPEAAREQGFDPDAVRIREGGSGAQTGGQDSGSANGEARTIDRIANPWGKRTPFGQGEDWPVRVDRFLEDGVSEDEVDAWVQTASLHHANGDALDLAVKDNRLVGVRGREVDRVNKGRVDPKDLFVWQAYNSEDRLTRPLVRSEDGELVEASWDEAMGRIVERSKELLNTPSLMLTLMAGVVILTAAGWIINRAFGVPMPLWADKG